MLFFRVLSGLLCFVGVLGFTASWANTALTSVPFRLAGSHIFIEVRLNDSPPLHFIFDTGAASTVVSERKARKLSLSSDGFTPVRGKQGPTLAYYSQNSQLWMGNLHLDRIRVVHLPLAHLEKALGKRVDGIVGHDLLKHYVVQINYDTQTIDLFDPLSFSSALRLPRISV